MEWKASRGGYSFFRKDVRCHTGCEGNDYIVYTWRRGERDVLGGFINSHRATGGEAEACIGANKGKDISCFLLPKAYSPGARVFLVTELLFRP